MIKNITKALAIVFIVFFVFSLPISQTANAYYCYGLGGYGLYGGLYGMYGLGMYGLYGGLYGLGMLGGLYGLYGGLYGLGLMGGLYGLYSLGGIYGMYGMGGLFGLGLYGKWGW